MTGPTTTELALRAQGGEREAFAALYDRHAAGVARVLASFVGPDHDALDDLVQDVFLRVVERLDAYRPVRPFDSWLFTIALNVGRNHARDRRAMIDIDTLVDPPRSSDPTSRWLDATDLVRAIAELDPPVREVVALRVGSDLSYEEIARILDLPVGTARRRMHTAVERLRRALAATNEETPR